MLCNNYIYRIVEGNVYKPTFQHDRPDRCGECSFASHQAKSHLSLLKRKKNKTLSIKMIPISNHRKKYKKHIF